MILVGNMEHFPGSSPSGGRGRCLGLAWYVKALQSKSEELHTTRSLAYWSSLQTSLAYWFVIPLWETCRTERKYVFIYTIGEIPLTGNCG